MKYEMLAGYTAGKFRRISGVKRGTFVRMVGILREAHAQKHRRRGRKPKLCVEEMLLATLEYLRECRTYAHIAASFGMDESNMCRTIRWVEDTLVRDGAFSLPGRKELLRSDTDIEAALVDATESPVQRPRKNSADTARARRSGTR